MRRGIQTEPRNGVVGVVGKVIGRDFDVVVVGAGVAGITAAIAAAGEGASVAVVTRGRLGNSGSSFCHLSRGWGISAATGVQDPADSPSEHLRDILDAAQGMSIPRLAEVLADEAPARLSDLAGMGVPLTPVRGCHCFNRRERSVRAFDVNMTRQVLADAVRSRRIHIIEESTVLSLLASSGRCAGVRVLEKQSDSAYDISSGAVVLASGGGTGLFSFNLGDPCNIGYSHYLALLSGATLTNMEFVQFAFGIAWPVPGALFAEELFSLRPVLTNGLGEDVTSKHFSADQYAKLCALRATHAPYTCACPSSAIDRAIYGEIANGRASRHGGVSLRIAPATGGEPPKSGLGEWLDWLRGMGADLSTGDVEIAPFAQAFNGGIVIDEHGRTSVQGLYACGEAAAGPHGADRVGGNMIASALVFGTRAGRNSARYAAETWRAARGGQGAAVAHYAPAGDGTPTEARHLGRLRSIMFKACSLVRDEDGLQQAIGEIDSLTRDGVTQSNSSCRGITPACDAVCGAADSARASMDLHVALTVSKVILSSALLRRESRGSHFRRDFPQPDAAYGGRIEVRMDPSGNLTYTAPWLGR